MLLRHEDLFHVGIVVDDLQKGMEQYGDSPGLAWRECACPTPDVLTPQGCRKMRAGAVYSDNGPLHYELIQRDDDGLWQQVGLHDLGYFTDDLVGDIERLAEHGFAEEGVMHRDGLPTAAYVTLAGAIRVELIPRSSCQRLIGREA
ncbi:VOC family protein [Streptomyces sp. NPDC051219]|uniref:VOC family protein n=1 Tax=Streptomyces sp. NPDC051219 TaxID=3155283 RepID=UPI0034155E4D